jgi:hypothetical protein
VLIITIIIIIIIIIIDFRTRVGEMRNANIVLVRNPKGKRPLGKCRHGSENNIKMDLREIDSEGMDWIHLAQDRYK